MIAIFWTASVAGAFVAGMYFEEALRDIDAVLLFDDEEHHE